jgi:hypothetical protein
MSELSRRSLVASGASLPALAVPAIAVAAAAPTDTLSQLADQICAEWDRLGMPNDGEDYEDSDWAVFNSLRDRLWSTPSGSISDLAAEARVLDKTLRINGDARSYSDRQWDFVEDVLALAVRS